MTGAELDSLRLDMPFTGQTFTLWTSATLADDFLSPCQKLTLEVAADETRFAYTTGIRKGDAFTFYVNDAPQCSGYVDEVEISYDGHSGTKVTIQARDGLSRLVDGNVDERMPVTDKMTLADLLDLLFLKQFSYPDWTIFEDNGKGRDLAVSKAVKARVTKRRKSIKDPLKDVRPHPGEGGYAYLTRICHRMGLHPRVMPNGVGVIIAAPEYDQDPAYTFVNLRGSAGKANNILRGRARSSSTGVPSHVWVRGKGSEAGPKAKYLGFYDNSANSPIFKPFYHKDDQATSKEQCDAVAAYIVGKAMREAFAYEITVRGFSDPQTGRVFNVDTIANVKDEQAGIDGKMWVESRTFRKSRAGTTTDLKLLPANALILDYLVADSAPIPEPNYPKAAAKVDPKTVPTAEQQHAAAWGSYTKDLKDK